MFALFMVVRQNLASAKALRRLSFVAMVNGSLVAVFALVQFWTARRGTVYWTFPSAGWVFGPFINHDHAAEYLNLCLGLTLGLLLVQSQRAEAIAGNPGWFDPSVLWLLVPLTILLVGVAFSLSRGGVLAFFGAAGLCLGLRFALGLRSRFTRSLLAIVGLALVLLLWFGIDPLISRFDTAVEEQGDPSRTRAWARVLPLFREFPLWGTGYGTFGPVELTRRGDVLDQGFMYGHAHNEYVEALVEGGFPRLLLTLAIIALVGRASIRVMRRKPDSLSANLAMGGLFAIATLVFHSVVEFGVHIPAIALLATVIIAQLSGMETAETANGNRGTVLKEDAEANAGFVMGGLTRVLAAVVVLGVAFVLAAEGWKAYRVDSLQSSAQPDASAQNTSIPEQIIQLEKAARLAPDDAVVHLKLAQAYLHIAEEEKKQNVNIHQVRQTAQAVLAIAALGDAAPTPPQLLTVVFVLAQLPEKTRDADNPLISLHESLAVQHLIRARNANPLLPYPYLHLAENVHKLSNADSPSAYLDRARRLAPMDPHLWYYCGLQELRLRHQQRMWSDWRHSLELSNDHLNDILKISTPLFPPDIIRTQILPDKPDQLLTAAFHLFPEDEKQAERRPFLEQALSLLEQQPAAARTPDDLHNEAMILASLNQPDKALKAYQLALGQQPHQLDWRWEFAKLLHKQGRPSEARLELRTILQEQPGNGRARDLWRVVEKEIAEKR